MPTAPGLHFNIDRQLNHLGFVEIDATHIDQYVGAERASGFIDRLAAWGRRQLKQKHRVKPIQRGQRRLGVSMVPFVHHDHGPHQPHHIAE